MFSGPRRIFTLRFTPRPWLLPDRQKPPVVPARAGNNQITLASARGLAPKAVLASAKRQPGTTPGLFRRRPLNNPQSGAPKTDE